MSEENRTPVTVVLDAMDERNERFRNEVLVRRVLDVKMQPNDANVETIRDYLIKLLSLLWAYGDHFPSKKPFGNSGWEYDLYEALVRAGLISGVIADGDYLDEFDKEAGDRLIEKAIKALGGSS